MLTKVSVIIFMFLVSAVELARCRCHKQIDGPFTNSPIDDPVPTMHAMIMSALPPTTRVCTDRDRFSRCSLTLGLSPS